LCLISIKSLIMKYIKHILIISLFFVTANIAYSQTKEEIKNAKAASIKALVESANFTFITHDVSPFSGAVRHLTSDYEVKVSKDTVVSYLPYFGRAYSYVDPNNAGFQFTSTNFTYNVSPDKKGWYVNVKIKDQVDNSQFNFRIFTNGSATLQVTSVNRDPISFSGTIQSNR
jgi:hypothetical protein